MLEKEEVLLIKQSIDLTISTIGNELSKIKEESSRIDQRILLNKLLSIVDKLDLFEIKEKITKK